MGTVGNFFKDFMAEKASGESYRCILMKPAFSFDIDVHNTYSDVSGEEIDTQGGYTQRGVAMTISGETLQDNVNNRGTLTFLDVTFSASPSGESYGPFGSAIIFANVGVSGENAVAGQLDFSPNAYICSGEFQIQEPTLHFV